MEPEEDVIETSDTEERETLRMGQDQYWTGAASTIHAQSSVFDVSSTRFSVSYNQPSPRKRIRLDTPSSPYTRDHSSEDADIPKLPINEDLISRSSSSIPSACPTSSSDGRASVLDRSPKSNSLVPTPENGQDVSAENAPLHTRSNSDDDSQDPMDMFMTQYKDANVASLEGSSSLVHSPLPGDNDVLQQTVDINVPKGSRSRSIDRLHLFTSPSRSPDEEGAHGPQHAVRLPATPYRMTTSDASSIQSTSPLRSQKPTSPPLSSDQRPLLEQRYYDNGLPHFISPRSPLHFPSSSAAHEPSIHTPQPIRLLGSLNLNAVSPEQHPHGPNQPSSPLSSASSPIPAAPVHHRTNAIPEDLLIDEEVAGRRYALRQRRPQQLQPYAYDQIVYKQQMKSNPDAIVRFRRAESPLHRVPSSYQAGTEMREANGEEASQEWTMDGNDQEEDADSWDHIGRANVGRSTNRDTLVPEAQVVPKHQWLLEGMSDLSSDDQDDSDVLKALKKAKMEERKAKKVEREKVAAKEREDRIRLQREREVNRRKKQFPVRMQTDQAASKGAINSKRMRSTSTTTSINDHFHGSVGSRGDSPTILLSSPPRTRSPSRHASSAHSDAHESPFGFDTDYNAFDEGDHPNGQEEIQLNSSGQPTQARSDDDQSSSPSHKSDSDDSLQPKLFQGKKLKILSRLMPKVMIRNTEEAAQEAARRQTSLYGKRKRSATADSSDDGLPLQPGQTRSRTGISVKNIDIKGDSESEDPKSDGLGGSDGTMSVQFISDNEGAPLQRPAIRSSKPQHVPYVSDDSGDETSDDEVDDVQINAWFANRQQFTVPAVKKSKENTVRMRDPHMVDYMLAATRTVGGSSARTRKQLSSKAESTAKSKGTSRRRARLNTATSGAYKDQSIVGYEDTSRGRGRLDIVTTGARKGQQTRLSFDGHSKVKKKRTYGHGSEGTSARGYYIKNADLPIQEEPEILPYRVDGAESAAQRKRRIAKKRARIGKYTFTTEQTHITSGHQTHAITIDIGDTHFQRALAPVRQSRPNHHTRAINVDVTHFQRTLAPADHSKPRPQREIDDHAYTEHGNERMPSVEQPHYDSLSPNRHPPLTRHLNLAPVSYHRDIKLDFDIPCLPAGTSFGPNSFIGRGWLKELIVLVRGDGYTCVPTFYAAHGIQLNAIMSISEISESLGRVVDGFSAYIVAADKHQKAVETNHWERLLHTICQHLYHLPKRSTAEESSKLGEDLQEQILRLFANAERDSLVGDDGGPSSTSLLNVHWFAIEAWAMFACSMQTAHPDVNIPAKNLVNYLVLLIDRLLQYGTAKALEPVLARQISNTAENISHRGAELWVCLFHFLSNCQVLDVTAGLEHPFWRMVLLALQHRESQPTLESSENVWRAIFGLCAFGQFSIHGMTTTTRGLPASWQLVEFALGKIRLSIDPESDAGLSDQTLSKRDEYIWMVASRCYVLSDRWQWKLNNAPSMFNHLADIFRSRKFANLRRERSDFPDFMLEHNMDLLLKHKSSDTAFQIFLKLIARAAKDGEAAPGEPGGQRQALAKLNKLLAMAIPIGSFPFTKASPPTKQELSMLYNRFSALAVNINLNPLIANIRTRLNYARRCADFKEGDETTRVACMRAAMHFTVMTCHHSTALEELLGWLGDMANVLVDEYLNINVPSHNSSVSTKNRILFLIQILLGAVRRAIEQLAIDHPQKYPETQLLTGSWLARIFSTRDLISSAHTGFEIRALVQEFLNARQAAMPKPKRYTPAVVAVVDEDSQEYHFEDFDMDDPQLQAALGNGAESAAVDEYQSKDAALCNVLNDIIAPAIYRLVCKHLHDPTGPPPSEEYCREADNWVDCWVGCANVIVRNGKRKWTSYLELGPQSWERIIDPSWRRRVGLRFMFMLLRLNPEAYPDYADHFVAVLLEALATAKVSLEHEYFAEVLTVDGMRHQLLRRMPCKPELGTSDYNISAADFMALRSSIIDAVLTNLVEEIHNKQHHQLQIQTYVGFVAALFSVMKSTYEEMASGSDERTTYSDFCRDVRERVQKHALIVNEGRLKSSLAWLHSV